jgi:phosphatidylinositol alpha-1,6-mannosyltransferase
MSNASVQPNRERQKKPIDMLLIASIYRPTPWGIAAFLDNLSRALIGLGIGVKVIALVEADDKERRSFLDTYEQWVLPLEVVYDQRPGNWFGNKLMSLLEIARCLSPRARKVLNKTRWFKASSDSVIQLDKILTRETPAVIVLGHLDLKFYPFVLHLQETQRPYGIIAHDFEFYYSKHRINDRIRRGIIIRGAKWIAANSQSTKSLVERWGIPQQNVVIVHPPLTDAAIKASHQLPSIPRSGVYTLTTVSRIVPSKGHDIVLHAIKILENAQVPCRYVIAGEGPERDALERLAVELGIQEKVHFAGFLSEDEKWRLLQSADVYVMTSRVNLKEAHEGFGIAFLEAAACGIPAIGSKAGGIEDAVVDGTTGILVEPDSPKQLADALMFLYQNPEKRKEMGKAGLERALSQFSPQAIASYFQREFLSDLRPH